jgi:chemotaxis protein MotA
MDIGTLVGLILAFGLPVVAIVIGGNPVGYLDMASVIIVIGGSLGFLLGSVPLTRIVGIGGIFSKALFPTPIDPLKSVETLVDFSERARREGILALENAIAEIDDEFLRTGIRLAVDGVEPELIKEILETEITFIEDRHRKGAGVFESLASCAPAFGMIGTLIGLVAMLQNLSDPSAIGGPMAIALLTTLYGAMIANAFAAPVAEKLKARSAEETLAKEVTIEGIMAIQSGDNPRIVQQRLLAFLPPAMRPKGED